MHTTNTDITIEEMSKIEGAATLTVQIRDGQLTKCEFAISEMQRFYTQALRGKPVTAVPGLVSRVCGTCSNAHLLASIKAIEHGLGIVPTQQTMILRKLLTFGLIIRDHGLHLYVFVLPDVYNRDSILAFDEHNETEHQLIHDCFDVKEAGNKLATLTGGRSVHAPFPRMGGFSTIPTKEALTALVPILTDVRPKILRLIDVFLRCPFTLAQELKFLALIDPSFSFLEGTLTTSDGTTVAPQDVEKRLNRIDIPYSQATGYLLDNHVHFVGALSRLNLNSGALHPNTKRDGEKVLHMFPSNNIFHNNLAQAIEMLHAVDSSIDLINTYQALDETAAALIPKESTGFGIIEAPRGMLYHRYDMSETGTVKRAKIIVPTGQNQIGIEHSIKDWIGTHIDATQEDIAREAKKIIRAYDPCMSCATHFLKLAYVS